jgi:hypothetical protein
MEVKIVSNRLAVGYFIRRLFNGFPQHPMLLDYWADPMVVEVIEDQLASLTCTEQFIVRAFCSEYQLPMDVITQGVGLRPSTIQTRLRRAFGKLRCPECIQPIKSALGLSFYPFEYGATKSQKRQRGAPQRLPEPPRKNMQKVLFPERYI